MNWTPALQLNKDWLKQILSGEKRLMKLDDVKQVNVGNYNEISVKHLYKDFSTRPEMKLYLPDKLSKGRQMDKEYFFNIANTLYTEEL